MFAVHTDVSTRLETLKGLGPKPSPNGDEMNTISSYIVKLRKDLVDATPYLPSYDRGKYEQVPCLHPSN